MKFAEVCIIFPRKGNGKESASSKEPARKETPGEQVRPVEAWVVDDLFQHGRTHSFSACME